MRKRMFFVLFLLTPFFLLTAFSQETLTITTYYPAPFGVYTNLRLYPSVQPACATANDEGVMYFDNNLHQMLVCSGDGAGHYSWQSGGLWRLGKTGDTPPKYYIYPNDLNWNVGIGTNNPTEKLEIKGGNIRLNRDGDATKSSTILFDFSDTQNMGYIYGAPVGPFTKQLAIVLGNNNPSSDPKYVVNDNSRIGIAVNGDGSTPSAGQIQLDSKILHIRSANVGIDVNPPQAKLDIVSSGDIHAPGAKGLIVRARFNYPFHGTINTCSSNPTDFSKWAVCQAAFDEKCGTLGYLGGPSIDWDSTGMEGFCFRKDAIHHNELVK
jgi:hypothetical protein